MQYKIFEAMDEAKSQLEKYKDSCQREEVGYCPLIQKTCNTKCVCFYTPRMVKRDKKFYVYSAACGNEMFFGRD